MKTSSSLWCLGIISLLSLSAHAGDFGGLDGEYSPNITVSDIKKQPSYNCYTNAKGASSTSWDQIANKVSFSATGPYKEFSNSFVAPFEHGGITWQSVKSYLQKIHSQDLDVMARAMYAKFAKIPWLKSKLLDTGSKVLVDSSDTRDNTLGKILMIVRMELGGKRATS